MQRYELQIYIYIRIKITSFQQFPHSYPHCQVICFTLLLYSSRLNNIRNIHLSPHSCLIKEYFREGVHAPRSYKKKYKRHRQHGCGSPHSDYFFVRILPHISPALSLLLFSARYSAKFNVKYYS